MMTTAPSALLRLCPECGTSLASGACPACALRQLLGSSEPEEFHEEDHAGKTENSARRAETEEGEFGRYTLKRRLAAGGMGVIYAAEDRKLKRTVALKMIRGSTFANEAEIARFTIEAEAAAALDHPHIVPIYEVGRLEGQPFFTMKLIEGDCLAGRLKKSGGPVPPREAAALLGKIARAVHHAHQRGVLHRDLKPGNILIDATGEPWLTDFGLAKLADTDSGLTRTSDHLGTPHYMSPEVADGRTWQVSTAGDVWALGVILWELLTGAPPFQGTGSVEIMRRIVEQDPVWPPGFRAEQDLVTVARRCMEKDPARRPESAGAVADELDRWLRGEPILARPVTQGERFVKWVRRKPVLATLYAVLAAAIAAGLFLWQRAEHAVVRLTETNALLADSLRISTATKLAGDARLQVDEDPARALLLAVESVQMTEHTFDGVLPEAASALTAVLQRVGGTDVSVRGIRNSYEDGFPIPGWWTKLITQISPDGRWLLSVNLDGSKATGADAALFDLKDPAQPVRVRRWHLWPAPLGSGPDLCWLADSRRILSVNSTGEVSVLDLLAPPLPDGSPPAKSWGSVACAGLEILSINLNRPENGPAPSGTFVWRSKSDPPETYFARVMFTETTTFPDAPGKAGSNYSDNTGYDVSPDGRWLLMKGSDRAEIVAVFDLNRPETPPLTVPGSAMRVFDSQFSGDGEMFVLRTENEVLRQYVLPRDGGAPVISPGPELCASPKGPLRLAISPDKQWLAMTGDAGEVTLTPLDGESSQVKLQLSGGNGMAVAFSADGEWIAAGGDRRIVHVWRMDQIHSGAAALQLRGLPTAIVAVGFSADGNSITAAGNCGIAVRRWLLNESGEGALPRYFSAGNDRINELAVSPDCRWFASACSGRNLPGAVEADEGFVVLSQVNGAASCVLGTHANRATSAVFSSDGSRLASSGRDGIVKVWDTAAATAAAAEGSASPTPRFEFSLDGVRTKYDIKVAFHPRGTLYAVCGDGMLFEWNLNQPDPEGNCAVYQVHSIRYLLPAVKVSPDGKRLAIARHGWDLPGPDHPQSLNQVLLFDVSQPGEPVPAGILPALFLDFTSLSFSSDSRWLAAGSAGTTPTIWDLTAADIPGSRRAAPVISQTAAGTGFSPDGKWLAIGGSDGFLHLWDWQHTGSLRTIHSGSGISTLAWLNDGRLATAGGSNRIALWDTDTDRQKQLANKLAGRALSDTERIRFRLPARR